MAKLLNKNAIVTGGARGIGKAITEKLIKGGARVLICSRNRAELIRTCKEIDPAGKKVIGIQADVSKIEDCKKLIDKAKKIFGRIDILVNNAGIYGPIGPFETNSLKKWQEAQNINFLGTVFCSQLVVPLMKKQKSGKIINLAGAGVGGNRPLARFSAYYVSKAAVVAFTEVLASELDEWNIQVNCISPGAINTYLPKFLLKQGLKKAGKIMYEQALNQMKSGGDPVELGAKLVAFLSSAESNHISGKVLSAKWDKIDRIKKMKPMNKNLYVLRRIDKELYYEKK